jgi:hypothetical protein
MTIAIQAAVMDRGPSDEKLLSPPLAFLRDLKDDVEFIRTMPSWLPV